MQFSQRTSLIIILIIGGILGAFLISPDAMLAPFQRFATVSSEPRSTQSKTGCVFASGNFWSGVKLYQNSTCSEPFATVLGGNDRHQFADGVKRGVKVQYPNGSEEWKEREAMARFYVKGDDPAIESKQWFELK